MKRTTQTKQHTNDLEDLWEGLFRGKYLSVTPSVDYFSRIPKDEESEVADSSAI